jgi:hypothetical protein
MYACIHTYTSHTYAHTRNLMLASVTTMHIQTYIHTHISYFHHALICTYTMHIQTYIHTYHTCITTHICTYTHLLPPPLPPPLQRLCPCVDERWRSRQTYIHTYITSYFHHTHMHVYVLISAAAAAATAAPTLVSLRRRWWRPRLALIRARCSAWYQQPPLTLQKWPPCDIQQVCLHVCIMCVCVPLCLAANRWPFRASSMYVCTYIHTHIHIQMKTHKYTHMHMHLCVLAANRWPFRALSARWALTVCNCKNKSKLCSVKVKLATFE